MNYDADASAEVQGDIRTLPFGDHHADRIVAVHVLEHVYPWEALPMLKEWWRVLKPGGMLTVELPCMDKVFAYIAVQWNKGENVNRTMCSFPLWGDPRYGDERMMHRWGYCKEDMQNLLRVAGYTAITNQPPRYHVPQRDMRFEAVKS